MNLVFDDQAIADIEGIYQWIAQGSPIAAEKTLERLFSSIELLAPFSRMGHIGHVPGTFEWVVPRLPYIVVYQVDVPGDRVLVTAVFHGAQSRED